MEMINAVLTQQTDRGKERETRGELRDGMEFWREKEQSHEELFRNFVPYKEFYSLVCLSLLSSLVNYSLHKFTDSMRDQRQERNKQTPPVSHAAMCSVLLKSRL